MFHIILAVNPHDPFFIILKVLGVALLICAVLALIAWFAENASDILGSLLPAPEPKPKKKEVQKEAQKSAKETRLAELSALYGKRLAATLRTMVTASGDTYYYRDCFGDDCPYKRIKEVDEDDGTEYDMTTSEIRINGKLVFQTHPDPKVLEEGSWIEGLLGIEDQMREIQAQEDKLQREREQEAKARAEHYARAEKLGKAACYIAKNLGKETKYRWSSDYRYERGDFIIETNRKDNPKLYYNGTCVLHLIYNSGDELQSSFNSCEIYHEGKTWETKLLDLEEDTKRQVKKRREKEQALREEEHRKNHLPLKDL